MTDKQMHAMVTMVVNTMAVNYNLPDHARKKLVMESSDTIIMLSSMDTELFHRISRRIEHWAYQDQSYFEQDPEVINDYKLI